MTKQTQGTAEATPKVFVVRTGDVVEVGFAEGLTLGEAIAAAGFNTDRVTDVRINNKKVKNMEIVPRP